MQKIPPFNNLDLNLLRIFRVLLREKNMRITAEKLHVTQPAISQSLQKLRLQLGDELFVKVAGGLEATPFAIELERAICQHFDALEQSLSNLNEFKPKEFSGTLRIALSHIVMPCIASNLYQRFQSIAPKMQLELICWGHSTPALLQSGEIFYGVHYDLDSLSKEIARRALTTITGVAIVGENHPHNKSSISLEEVSHYPIASHISQGWNDNFVMAQDVIASHGYEVNIGFRSSDLLSLIHITETSNMVLPQSNLFPIERFPKLKMLKAETDKHHIQLKVYGYTHSKNRNSALAQWLEGIVTDELNAAIARNPLPD